MLEAIKLTNLGTVNKNVVEVVRRFDDVKQTYGREARLYFSYETIVAVLGYDGKLYVSQNEWSTTTGKLLNELQPDKDARYPHSRIMAEAAKVMRGAIHVNP